MVTLQITEETANPPRRPGVAVVEIPIMEACRQGEVAPSSRLAPSQSWATLRFVRKKHSTLTVRFTYDTLKQTLTTAKIQHNRCRPPAQWQPAPLQQEQPFHFCCHGKCSEPTPMSERQKTV